MPKIAPKKNLFADTEFCRGGNSFNCARVTEFSRDENGAIVHDKDDSRTLHPHRRVNPVSCRLCGAYMGCEICAQRVAELICLRCKNWATDEALKKHGEIVRDLELMREGFKIWKLRGSGAITDQDVDRLWFEVLLTAGGKKLNQAD